MKSIIKIFLIIHSSFLMNILASQEWEIVLSNELANDEAIKVALEELRKSGQDFDFIFDYSKIIQPNSNSIIVGTPNRNKISGDFINANSIVLENLGNEQGFQICSIEINGYNKILISGGSILGEVYGIFWLVDRLEVNGTIPIINEIRQPAFDIRFSGGFNKEQMRQALRLGATWVWGGHSVNNLFPWNSEPERTENRRNRDELKELIDYAHSLHLKFIVYEDEFSYHPSYLEEFNASLNPEDPALWKAIKAKYRRLLKLLPEIDGIRIRSGESTRIGGNYKSFDVMHDGDSYWSLSKRYRTWVKNIHEVVVGEFNKIYYQRSWVTSSHEQHSVAEVYEEIFNDEIPVKNLYISPYLSTTDRFFFQPYNPTFNLTPHNMIVLLAPLNYHGNNNCGILPTFPGTYFQSGLKSYLEAENSNCVGIDFGVRSAKNWDTASLTAYTVYRLSWEPDINLEQITKDYAAIHFGKDAGKDVAEILLMTPNIYKYGIYIEPAAQGQFSSLTHLRLTTFPVKGLPRLDNGRKHIEFLRDIYYRCRPWIEETFMYLDHGLELAEKAKTLTENCASKIDDIQKREMLLSNAEMTVRLIELNNLYVKAFIAYFQFYEINSESNRERLDSLSKSLDASIIKCKEIDGFKYKLDGIEQLQKNITQLLEDDIKAKTILADSPDDEGIELIIDKQQSLYKSILSNNKDIAEKVVYWQGRIDGRDILKLRGGEIEIEHLRYDPIQEDSGKIFNPLPEKNYTVIPLDIQSRSYGPFILEQPNKNNNFTATVYLSDSPMHGYSWWKFELYYIPKSPEELGLVAPWNK